MHTLEIKNSKFIGYKFEVFSATEIEKHLAEIKKEHKKATHVCYAYVINSLQKQKFSDDGEPSGTAGKPILNVIAKKNLDNILVVVVRYYGGIKLGSGGLVRAYTKCAAEAINVGN